MAIHILCESTARHNEPLQQGPHWRTLANVSPARGCAVAVARLMLIALASFTIRAGPALVVICTGWVSS